jgi:hypothetical protein
MDSILFLWQKDIRMKSLRIAFYVSRYKDEDIQTPPSLQYLSGFLIANNLLEEQNLIFADTIDEILDFKPDILCIGSVSQTFFDAKNVAISVKKVFPIVLLLLVVIILVHYPMN